MRIISYLLAAAGILLLVSAGHDEFRGSTRVSMGRYGHSHYTVIKRDKPEEFRNAMTYHWIYASMLLVAGLIANMIDRGQDKVDPMSSDADESIDDELRKDEIHEARKEEKNGRPES